MNQINTKLEFTDIIDQILLREQNLTKENLSVWIDLYPQFEKQLIEFAAFEAVNEFAPENSTGMAASRQLESNWTLVENLIQKQFFSGQKEGGTAAAASTIVSLKSQADTQGLKFPQLAKATGLSLQLLLSLEQRLVKSATIPRTVIDRIASVLKTSSESISAYFEQPPQLLAGANYKSPTQPEIGEKKEFAELVREDMKLSPEEKNRLLEAD